MFRGFLSCFSGLSIGRSPTCFGLELFLGFLSFRLLGFPVLSSPCGVLRLTTLSLFLSVPRFLLDWMVRPPSSSVMFRRLLLFIGLLWVGRPVLFLFSVSLFLVCSWGLCSPSFPPSRLWSSRLALSFCRRVPGLLFASGSVLLPSLPSWSVGSPGSPHLGVPLCSGGLFPGLSLFCIFGLYRFGSLPSFLSCSSGVLRPGGCSFPWVGSSSTGVLALSSNNGPLWFCDLLSVSNLVYPSVVVFLCSSSIFVSSAVCLRRLCSLMPSRWGHPGLGRVSVLVSSTRSERSLSLLVSFVFLRDGVTLWVKCVFHSPLISIEGLL